MCIRDSHRTPLMTLCEDGYVNLDIIKLFVENKCDINVKNSSDKALIHYVCEKYAQLDIILYLSLIHI